MKSLRKSKFNICPANSLSLELSKSLDNFYARQLYRRLNETYYEVIKHQHYNQLCKEIYLHILFRDYK
jgi:hypothetical protein